MRNHIRRLDFITLLGAARWPLDARTWQEGRVLRVGILNVMLITVFGTALSAQAQPVADFYRGKTINLVVGQGVGGEQDMLGRAVAKYLGRHIPGNPLIIVQNMTGAGGMRAANYMYALAPQDGTSIGVITSGVLAAQAVGMPSVQLNTAKFGWMGTTAPIAGTIAVWHASGIKTIEDARRREVVLGATGRGTATYTVPAMMNEYLGTKFKIVTGYTGGNEAYLAMERGEIAGRYASWTSLKIARPAWLKEKKIIIIAKEGPPTTDLDAPSIEELAKTADERKIVELILSGNQLGRPFATTPGVPEARVSALRAAFDATMKDPEFLAEAARLNVDVAPISGIALQEIVERVLSTPSHLAARAKRLLE